MMNIKARISARKVVLSYFFQRFFVEDFHKKDFFFKDILKTNKIITWEEYWEKDLAEIEEKIVNYYKNGDIDSNIDYFLRNFFVKETELWIDNEYIRLVLPLFDEYKVELEEQINKHVTTFRFDEMDVVDKAIFLLGYIEFKKGLTDKKLIINEMIELAKRFWDEWSFKLINAIADKVLSK